MIDGTAGAMEPLLWMYAKGKPLGRDAISVNSVSLLSDNELKERIASLLNRA